MFYLHENIQDTKQAKLLLFVAEDGEPKYEGDCQWQIAVCVLMTILITLMETLHNEVTMQSVIISAQPTNGNQSERGRHNLFLSDVVTARGNERLSPVLHKK